MNVLILGSGGREHAFAWKISQSDLCSNLYVAPGNAGTLEVAENIALGVTDFSAIGEACLSRHIDLLVVGPEDPLVKGIKDHFAATPELKHIAVLGPDAAAAQLEGSKDFCKQFMLKYGIPTAAYKTFSAHTLEEGKHFLETLEPPYVLKADGLAAGKGVLIIQDLAEAKAELENMLKGKFGAASKQVVIEEYLDGIEFSVFALTDGKHYKILPVAKDYKRIGEGDTGLNTGGMGAISPVSFVDDVLLRKVEEAIVKPTVAGFAKEGMDYKGFVFFGLTNVQGTPKVIEYNVRMGDPETEVVLPRIKSDLLPLLMAACEERLDEVDIEHDPRYATTVVLVSGGYPEDYEKNKEISGLHKVSDSLVFHAGTKSAESAVLTSGGRVLAISSYGNTKKEALAKSYASIANISFDKMNYRKDIGFDLD
jgi:phosphoribosylamine--glycine ligase